MTDKNTDKKSAKTPDKTKIGKGPVKNKIIINPDIDDDIDPSASVSSPVEHSGLVKESAPTALARLHRAQVMRRIAPKLQRAKKQAEARRASDERIKMRADRKARSLVRQRLIGASGRSYEELSTGEKIQVDKRLEAKVGLIKRIAKRILPAVRKAEMERLSAHTHKDMVDTKPKTEIKLSEAFDHLDGAADDKHTSRYKQVVIVGSDGKKRVVTRAVKIKSVEEGLQRKSEKTGIPMDALWEVYERGLNSYDEKRHARLTAEQYAFGRVNKFVAEQNSIDEDVKAKFKRRISEEIKGWKNAGSAVNAARRELTHTHATVRLKKDGSISKMADARKTFPSLKYAEDHISSMKNLNPSMQGVHSHAIIDLKTGKEVKRV